MDNSVDTIKKAFEHHATGRLPRGELWLGTDLLKSLNLEDDLQGHIALVRRLRQDLLCLPVSEEISVNKALGYRYFSLKELKEVTGVCDLFWVTIVDGPFQRLSQKMGLIKILTGWRRERREIENAYQKERADVQILIEQCLDLPVDAVVIADDLAGERSPFLNPDDIQDLFSPFYARAVSRIHKGDSYALFHSCGNITRLVPQLVSCGFDGLAAIQHQGNDLISLRKKYGSSLVLMAGIEAETLGAGKGSSSGLEEYRRLLRSLGPEGGFIISSSTGLYSAGFLERLEELYQIADELSIWY